MTNQTDYSPTSPIPGSEIEPRVPAEETPPAAPLRRIPLPSSTPIFTYVFLAANIIVFLIELALNSAGVSPPLRVLGWKDGQLIAAGEYWRLVTPLFLHGGLAHLFFNSYALYIVGPQVERVFGNLRFLVIYLFSGIAGVLASMAARPAVPSVGASGAIFGLIGALIVYFYRHRELFGGFGRNSLMSLVRVAVLNLLIGFAPGIDNWGHIGGLVGGAGITALLGPTLVVEPHYDGTPRLEDRTPIESRWWTILFSGFILLVLTTIIIFLQS